MTGNLKWFCTLSAVILFAGCSSSEFELIRVSGTVNFTGGNMPQAEIAQIQFVPLPSSNSAEPGQPRTATGDIKPDGSFQLRTFDPGDGAVPGEYKVVLRVWKSYANRESLIPSEYEAAATTPLEAVVSDENTRFTFDVNLK